MNTKIFGLVIIGNIIFKIPILLFIKYEFYTFPFNFNFFGVFLVFLYTYIYYAIVLPIYKLISINIIKTKTEYILWQSWNIKTLVFLPKVLRLHKIECWGVKNLDFFIKKRNYLLNCNN